jgi:hypothetical protein
MRELTPTRSSPAVSTLRHTPPGRRLDLVDDAGRRLAQEFHVERIKIRGHAVGRGYRAQAHDIFVGASPQPALPATGMPGSRSA